MQKKLSLKLLPSEANDDTAIRKLIAATEAVKPIAINGYNIIKRSIDARGKQTWIHLTLLAYINEPWQERGLIVPEYRDVHAAAKKVIIIGAGPAGLFAALKLIELGIKPIMLERGKDVRSRRRDLAALNKEGIINPESNYCFGEGGAGTYSDGKLYTRSTKRGDVNRILSLFVHFGAEENIAYESHPHIGTNKLPQIITAMRKQITDSGGDFLFEKKLTDLIIQNNIITGVVTSDGNTFNADAVILATGHSARDIFQLLNNRKIKIECKPFALGVRVEHPQSLIDRIQYHTANRGPDLPPSSYSLVEQVQGSGVFSFCMCPGGIIAPAATAQEELVVNGWSPSKRNNPYANSGMVVTVSEADAAKYFQSKKEKKVVNDALLLMYFQRSVEHEAYKAGGGKFVAPAQRLVDFCENKLSSSFPDCSYVPGIHAALLKNVLPSLIHQKLQQAFKEFGKKMKGYYTNDAVVVATESRTSSPVRIPRNDETLQHIQIKNLYPCGEGAGYAGGIVSAAMDGERVAQAIVGSLKS